MRIPVAGTIPLIAVSDSLPLTDAADASVVKRCGIRHGDERWVGPPRLDPATCKLEPESRRNLKPTKPAIQISDADRKRKILITLIITDKCTMAVKKWREKGESFRTDPSHHRQMHHGRQEMARKRRVLAGRSLQVH